MLRTPGSLVTRRPDLLSARERLQKQATCHRQPWLVIQPPELELLGNSDDAIDTLVSAIVARVAVMKGRPTGPPLVLSAAYLAVVKQEGWIHLPPAGSLDCLPATATTWPP